MAIFAVTTQKGPHWDHNRQIREQSRWVEHARYADELVARGIIILGGPIGDAGDDDIALIAVEATDESDVHAIFADDPWTVSGVFRIKEVRPWTWWLGPREDPAQV